MHMGTWENLQIKHGDVNADFYKKLSSDTIFTNKVVAQRSSTVVIACRGSSFEKLRLSRYPEACDVIVVVNDWLTTKLPKAFTKQHQHKIVNYLTNMRDRQFRYGASIGVVRHHGVQEAQSILYNKLPDSVRAGFDKLLNTKDTGLRAIASASLYSNNLIIGGLDFWEAPYWGMEAVPKHDRGRQKALRAKMIKGTNNKILWMVALIEYIRLKKDTRFSFYTSSGTLHKRLKLADLSNVTLMFSQHFYDPQEMEA